MDRKIRVVQYGAGKMSRYLMRYVLEHGGELVGAFCRNKNHIGKDVSEIIGDGFGRCRQAHRRAQAGRVHNRNAQHRSGA